MQKFIAMAMLLAACPAWGQQWRSLIDRELTQWEKNGDGIWTVLSDGTLIGQRPHPSGKTPLGVPFPVDAKQYGKWLSPQSWLYTKAEFGEFDLHVEYWIPPGGNSGVSIRDSSRGMHSFGGGEWKTPAHIGFEIQIIAGDPEKNPTGSLYDVASAPVGLQIAGDWNQMDIESRKNMIRVRVNGKPASQHPGVEGRPLTGPVGLQLHDAFSFILFRNIRIREGKK